MQCLPYRQQQVLEATVRHYVDTIEPVGSQALLRRFDLTASSATIRSAMGALEQRGFLTQPHPSAGRIPSQQGYRHFVDCLLPTPSTSTVVRLEKELTSLSLRWLALDDLLRHLARRLADLTGLLGLITRPGRPQPHLQAVRLVGHDDRLLVLLVESPTSATHLNLRIPQESAVELEALEQWTSQQLQQSPGTFIDWNGLPSQIKTSGEILREALQNRKHEQALYSQGAVAMGLGGLLAQPEFRHSASLRPLLQLMEEQPHRVLVIAEEKRKSGVWIGAEHPHPALEHCAVVQAPYHPGTGGIGQVALVGPMRMAYSTSQAAVRTVARHLERLLA
uniref:Negative regulator of class I heat shock protein n=1 Tax=Paulinella chromatophora TaxID=39717 RepID=B1X4A0_PAUCH|nr:Negative regulator of class I heat shock protein [Paulinella chromatophora]ACB42769.1 Negative regulator of class I heat shock protein [Paulinella chromatophora]|eukprot:gb/GEZN01002854.1/.p1 GENE.gb/GEZN01002854.1/~~gb/GEZN01002854.1/.p1  ORF type:complete len:335 (+),score=2.14 gb/GEZN01002854.1/:1261-2265(+)